MTAAIRESEVYGVLEHGCAGSCVAAEVVQNIRAGRYSPGMRLPAASALAERFGVNRHTVRRAIAQLAACGIARVVQGSGTYVQKPARELMLGGGLVSR